jgi:uncharacterized membrane protein YtjA (UPF0391 family)
MVNMDCLFINWKQTSEEETMLYWTLVFLVIALVAAALGFGGIAAGAGAIAKVLFVVFLVLALISGIAHLSRARV